MSEAAQGLPIHFFTIVLNGEPFIRHHLEIFQQLPCDWHWHIVEGVASLVKDTAWSVANGGQIKSSFHDQGRSNDGTSAYLDELAAAHPDRIHIYRKPLGEFWDGKLEMVNAPLPNIRETCLLWQVDVDEYWTLDQILEARKLFQEHPDRKAAFYWCHFYVGQDLVISSRDTYGNNSSYEWLRTWRFEPGDRWLSHEPPHLISAWRHRFYRFKCVLGFKRKPSFRKKRIPHFDHATTEARGLVFQHLAYVHDSQLSFKETYYGYKDALAKWKSLQDRTDFPVALKDVFEWVKDEAQVERASKLGLPTLEKPGGQG